MRAQYQAFLEPNLGVFKGFFFTLALSLAIPDEQAVFGLILLGVLHEVGKQKQPNVNRFFNAAIEETPDVHIQLEIMKAVSNIGKGSEAVLEAIARPIIHRL